jgi:hypothetical protein
MRALLKPKLLGLIVVFLASLAWLRDWSVQFAIGIGERLAEALNLISGVVSGVSAVEYVVVAKFFGPWAPAADSSSALILKIVLAVVPIVCVGVFIGKLAFWSVKPRHPQGAWWICSECFTGIHQRCRGALFSVSHGGAQRCHCEHCALNR